MWKIFRRLQKQNKIAAWKIFKIPIFVKGSHWERSLCALFKYLLCKSIQILWKMFHKDWLHSRLWAKFALHHWNIYCLIFWWITVQLSKFLLSKKICMRIGLGVHLNLIIWLVDPNRDLHLAKKYPVYYFYKPFFAS